MLFDLMSFHRRKEKNICDARSSHVLVHASNVYSDAIKLLLLTIRRIDQQ